MTSYESAARHGVSTIILLLGTLITWVNLAAGYFTSHGTAPAGIPQHYWTAAAVIFPVTLTALKGAQAVAAIIGQYFGSSPSGASSTPAPVSVDASSFPTPSGTGAAS